MANDIEVRIGAQTRDLQEGMQRASSVIANSLAGIQQQMSSFGNMINGVMGAVGGAGLAMLGQQAVSVMSSFEQLEIRLNSVMGSAEKGQQAFAWIQQFAKDTPFQVGEVTQSFMLLKNMGLDPMDGTMKAVADRAAQTGGGFETLQRISLALGQAWTKNKLQGEEANQMLEAGVPVWDLLSKVMGKTTQEVQELSEKGRLGRDVIKALIVEIGKSSDGAAVAQMQSMAGMWSNTIDNIQGALNRLRKDGALDPLKTMLSEINAEFARLDKNGTLAQWSSEIAANIKAVGDGVMTVGKFLAEYSDQILLLAQAYVVLKAAQAGSAMAESLQQDLRKKVESTIAAKELAAADLQSATASSVAAKQALLRAEAESIAAKAEMSRASAQVESAQASLRAAQAETGWALRTRLVSEAQAELTAALTARNAAVARADAATEALNVANAQATGTTAALTAAQTAFARATTLAGIAARGFAAVMGMLGGPVGLLIIVLAALALNFNAVAEAAGSAAARAENAAERIKKAAQEATAASIKQLQGEKETARVRMLSYDQQLKEGGTWQSDGYGKRTFQPFSDGDRRKIMEKREVERGILISSDAALNKAIPQYHQQAYQPILDKYKGESPEGRKEIDERNNQDKPAGPPALNPERAKAGRSPKSKMSDWNTEIETEKNDYQLKNGMQEMPIQQEIAFWEARKKEAEKGTNDADAAEKKISALRVQELRQTMQESVGIARIEIEKRKKSGDDAIALEQQQAQQQLELGNITKLEYLAQERAFESRRYALAEQALKERLALTQLDPAKNVVEVAQLNAQLEELEREHQRKLAEIKGQEGIERDAPSNAAWQGVEGDLGSMYTDGLQRMLDGTLSFKEAMRNVWGEISQIMISNLVTKPAAEFLAKQTADIAMLGANEAKKLAIRMGFMKADVVATGAAETSKTGATIVGETSRTGAATVGAATRTSLSAGEAITNILNSAYEAMAGAFKAIVGIPYVGPALAVGAGAAAFAAVSGIVGKVKSASGGYSIPRGVNPMTQLHEEEMVLPKPYANVIREMAEGKGGNGGDSSQSSTEPAQQYNINISAVDAHSVRRLLQDNGKALVDVLRQQGRNFAGTKT